MAYFDKLVLNVIDCSNVVLFVFFFFHAWSVDPVCGRSSPLLCSGKNSHPFTSSLTLPPWEADVKVKLKADDGCLSFCSSFLSYYLSLALTLTDCVLVF